MAVGWAPHVRRGSAVGETLARGEGQRMRPEHVLGESEARYRTLFESIEEMGDRIVSHFLLREGQEAMRENAMARAAAYAAEPIMRQFMRDLGLGEALDHSSQPVAEMDHELGFTNTLAQERSVA